MAPNIVAVLHFSLLHLHGGTLAGREHSVPWEVSHMCTWGKSCCSQSSVRMTVIVVPLVCKRIISSPLFLNVYWSPCHFSWFSKHRFLWNWSVGVSEGLDTQFFPSVTRWGQEEMFAQWELLEERWLWCFLILCKNSFLILFNQFHWEWRDFPAFLPAAKCPLHCWFLVPL